MENTKELSEANKTISNANEEKSEDLDKSLVSSMQDFKMQSSRAQMINFFNSYAMFINDASNIILDLDVVLAKLVDAITKLKPPERCSSNINELWASLLEINKKGVEDLAETLMKLPEQRMHETVQDLERLNIKLMIEYNMEVKRGKQLKIINNDE